MMERWQQVESLFQEALHRDPAQRDAWLREACHGDPGLQHEVASLLANNAEADFEPWAAAAAARLIAGPASLQAGRRLGPYEILSAIGAGGMGEVYKARDTRLNRDVAIKICAAEFSERFQREARAIASLNHPNICQLYDVGPNFLVMELVEGENLSGPLSVETALKCARQIAEALEAAHEKGIVHRDLKPGNVKITPAGAVKVLDFGLAKAAEEPAAAGDPSNSPTLTISPTRAGVILGTAAYMSPEQARGARVDKRADIWAFGCVLYEMLTGKQMFHGETTSDILAAVLKEEPDWTRISPRVQPLLRRCLAKDPKYRLRDIGDAMPLLDSVPESAPARRLWPWITAAALAIVVAATLGVSLWRATRFEARHSPIRLSAGVSPGTILDRFAGAQLTVSPDGTRIVVLDRDPAGKWRMEMRSLDQTQFSPIPLPERALMPFFSPDGQWIGFFAGGKLKKISVQGGSPITLCDVPNLMASRGASWGDDGNIVAAFNSESAGLVRVSSGGGAPTLVTELNEVKGQTAYTWPQVLQGSQSILVTAYSLDSLRKQAYDEGEIDIVSIQTGKRKTLQRGGFFGRYVPSGHLVYIHEGTLFAAPFDISRLAVTGSPQPVVEDVNVNVTGGGDFALSGAASGHGTLAYASSGGHLPRWILWLDSTGRTQPLDMPPGNYDSLSFSPDAKRLAFSMPTSPVRADIWIKDLDRGTLSRLTHLPGRSTGPVWTPDGKSVVFASIFHADAGLYWIRADGAGEPQRLTDTPVAIPRSFSPDGKQLAYYQQSAHGGRAEIWTAPVEGDPDRPRLGKAEPFPHTSFDERYPAFSPDGRWLAYSSNETGTHEVYVRPFPGPGGKSQISTGGGGYPIWSRNGRVLFFLTSDWRIMAADCTANRDSFAAGKPKLWSPKTLEFRGGSYPYELAPDGKRFAVVLNAVGMANQEQRSNDSITVVLNFFDELRRLVPAGGK